MHDELILGICFNKKLLGSMSNETNLSFPSIAQNLQMVICSGLLRIVAVKIVLN